MDADIAQRVQAALAVASHQQRAGGGVEPEIAAIVAEPGLVVGSDPSAHEDSVSLGGEYIRATQQLRVGDYRVDTTEPLADRGDAFRKIHWGFADSVRFRRQTEPDPAARSKGLCPAG